MPKGIAPGLTRVAGLGNPKTAPFDYFKGAAEAAAPSLAVEIVPAPVANVAADIERAITWFAASPNGGLLVLPDQPTGGHRDLIVALTARHRLPAVYPFRLFVAAGGLMAYGTDQADVQRLAASYLDRILRGASPAELPVQAPTKYETVILHGTYRRRTGRVATRRASAAIPQSASYRRPSVGYAYVFRGTDPGLRGGAAGPRVCRGKNHRHRVEMGTGSGRSAARSGCRAGEVTGGCDRHWRDAPRQGAQERHAHDTHRHGHRR